MLRILSFLFLRVGLLRTQSEEPAPHNLGVSREGTCSSKTLAKPQRSQARHPSRTIIITERFLEGQSQNKQSASQGSNTSPYHRLWRPRWYLVAVTWVIFLSNSISLARLLPLWSSFFFFNYLSRLSNNSYLVCGCCLLPERCSFSSSSLGHFK